MITRGGGRGPLLTEELGLLPAEFLDDSYIGSAPCPQVPYLGRGQRDAMEIRHHLQGGKARAGWSRFWGLEFGVSGLGFRVWGLEFGLEVRGLGVLGLEV